MKTVRAFAPASIGNVAVGFDILGMAIADVGDFVEISGVETTEAIDEQLVIENIVGLPEAIPLELKKNTAGMAVLSFLKDHPLQMKFSMRIQKGIPLSSGMGGSAASAVAAVVAINEFLPEPLPKADLLKYAVRGETVASGSAHADNVAPSLFGGLQLVYERQGKIVNKPLTMPASLSCVVVNPSLKIDTKKAREILQDTLPLQIHVKQSAALAGFVAGCLTDDIDLLRDSLKDILIEPQRSSLIPGFKEVKEAALEAGAIGLSISGAGPSVFALADDWKKANDIASVISAVFLRKKLFAKAWVSRVNLDGAKVVS